MRNSTAARVAIDHASQVSSRIELRNRVPCARADQQTASFVRARVFNETTLGARARASFFQNFSQFSLQIRLVWCARACRKQVNCCAWHTMDAQLACDKRAD